MFRSHRLRRLAVAALLLVVAGVGLALHIRRYASFFTDDAFISLRYAQRLLAGEGLTWTEGERVEGYSNLLWVLLEAAGGVAGADLVGVARTLGVLGSAAVLVALLRLGASRPSLVGPALGLAFFVGSGTVAAWTWGGLEQPLLGALLAWALAGLLGPDPPGLLPPLLLGFACWTRPDTPVLVAGLGLGWLVARRFRREARRYFVILTGVPALFVLAQLAFRLGYYHDWVPNTAHVKIAADGEYLARGRQHVEEGLTGLRWLLGAVLLVGGFGAWRFPAVRRTTLVLVPPLLAWLVYLVAIGGDLFNGWRHFYVVVVILVFLLAEAVTAFVAAAPRRAPLYFLLGLVVAGLHVNAQLGDARNQRAMRERWQWEGRSVGRLLVRAFGTADPLYAVTAAGTLPYFTGFRALDMLGLCDRHIATRPRKGGWFGHDHGDGAYVLDRAPDLISFCGPRGSETPCFAGEKELVALPAFKRRYTSARFEAGGSRLRFRVWIDHQSPRVGVRRGEDDVELPPQVFADTDAVLRWDAARGQLGLDVAREARLVGLDLGPGTWEAEVDGPGTVALAGAHPTTFPARLTAPFRGDLLLETEQPGRLFGVRLHRVVGP